MINETRAAEHGSKIIDDTAEHTFPRRVIAIKALEDTVIDTITSVSAAKLLTENITYYDGATIYAGDTIEANVATIQLTSGAVQAFYQA